MLSREDNELMCRVGAGAPMGEALRRYWIPALQSSDLSEPDGDPRHLQLLGSDFVAFRDSNGQVGVLDERCCHRGASLVLGRVEGCGIRCIYHGWKFAVDGAVMDTPNVSNPEFKTRFKAKAYPVREAGGLIWVYVGPPESEPEFPHYPWFDLPQENRLNAVHVVGCNFVQVLEGLADSSHLGVLHADGLAQDVAELDYSQKIKSMGVDLAPRMEADETPFGMHYVALRSTDEGTEARVCTFVAPFTILNPNGDIATIVTPMNDEQSLFFHVFWSEDRTIGADPLRTEQLEFVGLSDQLLDAAGLSLRTYETAARPSRGNRWLQDREKMRKGRFSGLPGIIPDDAAVTVSAGVIADRSIERLCPADVGVVFLRRAFLNCVRRHQAGDATLLADASRGAARARGLTAVVDNPETWRDLVPDHLAETKPATDGAGRRAPEFS